jgi:hypothetical protein
MSMTAKLKDAVRRAEMLPKERQDEIAEQLLASVEAAESRVPSSSKLAEMGREAARLHKAGKTIPMDC